MTWQQSLRDLLTLADRSAQNLELLRHGASDFQQTFRARLDDGGPDVFVKVPASPGSDVLAAEADGLEALDDSGVLRVPGSRQYCPRTGILVMEFVETGPKTSAFEEQLGSQLAEHHKTSASETYGWHRASYLGATRQDNTRMSDWPLFFASCRLEPQIRQARDRGLSSRDLDRFLGRILERVDVQLATDESASLIHGDLWSGNALANHEGTPIVIDPACSFSDRLAELGMTRLFGGFSERFYSAYSEAWPLPAGAHVKIEHYTLYHLLNHLNLFGQSYLQSCENSARQLARA